jgi:signal transduction histidine kinase
VERNLHDGALEQLDQALSELRELARGIHPAILSDRGLKAAVGALAERQLLPTEIEFSVKRKLEPSVEATAYFMIAEGLANIAKYAKAKQADVQVREQGGTLEVEVADDGCGGADASKGTGLRGLEERLRAAGRNARGRERARQGNAPRCADSARRERAGGKRRAGSNRRGRKRQRASG